MLFLRSRAKRYGLGLSNELIFIIIGKKDAKQRPVKCGGLKKILAWAELNPFLLSTVVP